MTLQINYILPLVPLQRNTHTPFMFAVYYMHKAFVCAEKCGKSNSSAVCHVTCLAPRMQTLSFYPGGYSKQ